MKPSDLVLYRAPVGWRWLVDLMWRLEHGFERAKAAGKAEDDTRLRIFLVLALFAVGFAGLGLGAVKTAVPSDSGRGAATPGGPRAPAPIWLTARGGCWPSIWFTTASISIRARSGTRARSAAPWLRRCRN